MTTTDHQPLTAISIAGFDPSAGAGVLSDIKTFEQHGIVGFGVNTALTYQNDNEFDGIDWCTETQIIKQIEVLQRRFHIPFAKIGLIESLTVLKTVITQLKKQKTQIIWDPILKASAGFEFHSELNKSDLIDILKQCYLITPNKDEFDILNKICKLKNYCSVLLKGGHAIGNESIDLLYSDGAETSFTNKRLEASKHGSGCVLSAAITANLNISLSLNKAIRMAKSYTTEYLLSTDSLLGQHKGISTNVKEISELQFITQKTKDESHAEICKKAIKAGVKWVQLRVKDASDEEILSEALKCKSICQENNATFILNDRVDIAQKINADGVHLGKNDMQVSQARELLGHAKIIGGTANCFEDILHLTKQGVDYIGLGPFRFTETKKNLSPILGLNGYHRLIYKCKQAGIETPIIAIGGIREDDITELMSTNISGIALSGLIARSQKKKQLVKEIKTKLNA